MPRAAFEGKKMAIETKQIELETSRGPAVFHVSQVNGVRAMKTFLRLANKFGPALTALGEDKSKRTGALVLSALLEKLDGEEYERLQGELLGDCVATVKLENGEDSVIQKAVSQFGDLFAGHTFELGKLLIFALEVNFGNFFTKIGLSVPDLKVGT